MNSKKRKMTDTEKIEEVKKRLLNGGIIFAIGLLIYLLSYL